MQKKSGIMKCGLDAMPLFLLDDVLISLDQALHTDCRKYVCIGMNPNEFYYPKQQWYVARCSTAWCVW